MPSTEIPCNGKWYRVSFETEREDRRLTPVVRRVQFFDADGEEQPVDEARQESVREAFYAENAPYCGGCFEEDCVGCDGDGLLDEFPDPPPRGPSVKLDL